MQECGNVQGEHLQRYEPSAPRHVAIYANKVG